MKYAVTEDTLGGLNMFKWGEKLVWDAYFNVHLLKNAGFRNKRPGKIRRKEQGTSYGLQPFRKLTPWRYNQLL